MIGARSPMTNLDRCGCSGVRGDREHARLAGAATRMGAVGAVAADGNPWLPSPASLGDREHARRAGAATRMGAGLRPPNALPPHADPPSYLRDKTRPIVITVAGPAPSAREP